jgi:release factor glutamine methyltransferase
VGTYDLVVSNPPYVGADEIGELEPEVRDWEPRIATIGDDHTEALASSARDALAAGGWLVLEVADGRGEETAELLRNLGYARVRPSPDLAGRDRVVEGQWTVSTKP